MKKFIVLSTFLLLSQQALAAKRPCVQAEFDLLSGMAKYAGYTWTGTLKTCTADENPGYAIYWSAPAAGGVMSATLKGNPDRMQFMTGGHKNLFCMVVTGGRWLENGKDCK
jgi:hypothetical protein